MKKTLLFALAVVAMVACKKTPYNPVDEGNEIKISSSTMSTKALLPDYEVKEGEVGSEVARNNFFEGDKIGIFLSNQSGTNGGTFTAANEERINVGYTFGTPYWELIPEGTSSSDIVKRLMYPKVTPAVANLYAYFPYCKTGSAGYAVSVAVNADGITPEIKFNYAERADKQAVADTLRVLDLMFAKEESDNAISSKAIPLAFNHLMTQLQFQFKLANDADKKNGTVATTRVLKAIEVRGKNIIVDDATLSIADGTLTPGAKKGSAWVKYLGAGQGKTLTSKADGDFPADAEELHHMLIFPFDNQVESENEFIIYLAKNTDEITDLAAAVEAGDVDRYVIPVRARAFDGQNNWKFDAGRANIFTVKIDVANKGVNVTTSIVPWSGKVAHDVPAE